MKKLYLIIAIVLLAFSIGIIIGYEMSPLGTFECFRKLNYQNVTCFEEGRNYHCVTEDGTGYYLENVIKK